MEPNKDKIVIFTRNNARIYTNIDSFLFLNDPNAIINPDLSSVKNIPPHFWRLVDGRVLPMNDMEREDRLKHINDNGVDNGQGYSDISTNEIIIRPVYIEIQKEVFVDKVVEVEKIVEKTVEVPVEKIVETIKEVYIPQEKLVTVEVIKEVVVTQEKLVEVMVPKYIEKEIIHPYEIIKEVMVVKEVQVYSKPVIIMCVAMFIIELLRLL